MQFADISLHCHTSCHAVIIGKLVTFEQVGMLGPPTNCTVSTLPRAAAHQSQCKICRAISHMRRAKLPGNKQRKGRSSDITCLHFHETQFCGENAVWHRTTQNKGGRPRRSGGVLELIKQRLSDSCGRQAMSSPGEDRRGQMVGGLC